jgi:membrane-anchored glycerophosphoryl diester phosphodiesterase (GDPDase)
MQNEQFNVDVIKPVECLKEAWELVKPQYWILFAVTIIGVMIGGATIYILLGVMMCGIYLCYLQAVDGQKVEIETLFKNFKYFLPSLFLVIVMVVPAIIVMLVIYIPLLMAAIMGSKLSESELMTLLFGSFAVEVVVAIIMVCLHTLLMFAFPLIVDRNLSSFQAMKLSAKAVWKNLGGVTGIWVLMFLVNVAGMLALCIGVYFTIPIVFATQLVAYRKVFPKLNNQTFNAPPMPNAYNL